MRRPIDDHVLIDMVDLTNGQPVTVTTRPDTDTRPGEHHAAQLHTGILCPTAHRDGAWQAGTDLVNCPTCLELLTQAAA